VSLKKGLVGKEKKALGEKKNTVPRGGRGGTAVDDSTQDGGGGGEGVAVSHHTNGR